MFWGRQPDSNPTLNRWPLATAGGATVFAIAATIAGRGPTDIAGRTCPRHTGPVPLAGGKRWIGKIVAVAVVGSSSAAAATRAAQRGRQLPFPCARLAPSRAGAFLAWRNQLIDVLETPSPLLLSGKFSQHGEFRAEQKRFAFYA